jgi:hypothetical protein
MRHEADVRLVNANRLMTASPEFHSVLIGKFIRRTAVSLLFVGVVLFGAAGTLNWPEAWLYLALASAISLGAGLWMARNDPALLSERLRSPFQREQKPWDKAVMAVMLALWIGWLILMDSISAITGPTCQPPSRRSVSRSSSSAHTSSC